jgi:hypothetical protein
MAYELFWSCTLNGVALGMVFLLGFPNGDILCYCIVVCTSLLYV